MSLKQTKRLKVGRRAVVIEERSVYDMVVMQTYLNQVLKEYNPVIVMATNLSYAIKSKRFFFWRYTPTYILKRFTVPQIAFLLKELEELEAHGVNVGKKKL